MLKEYREPLAILFCSLDFWTIVISYYIVCNITIGDIQLSFVFLSEHYLLSFWVNIISWLYFSHYFQLHASKRLRIRDELLDLLKTLGIPVVLAATPSLLSRPFVDAVDFFIRLLALQVLSLVLLRSLPRALLKYRHSRGFNTRQVLIVGRNDRAARLAERIEQSPELGFRLVGFIDAPNGKFRHSYDYAFNVLGDLEDFERVLRENIVDEVFLTLPIKSFYSEIDQLIKICETVGIEAKIPTDIFRLRPSRSTISHYLDLAVIDV